MLQLPEEFENYDGFLCLLRGWSAYCSLTGAHMRRSYGRRKSGRPRRYAVTRADGSWFHLTAQTDREAVMKANEQLARESKARGEASSGNG